MYSTILALHSVIRWIVLILLIAGLIKAFSGWFGRKHYGQSDNKLNLFNMIALDVNVLLGFLLYLVFSPMTKAAFADFGAAMKNPDLRFWAVEHILVMLIALALIHVLRKRLKRDIPDVLKHRKSAIFYLVALVLILSRIPWQAARLDFVC